MPILHCTVSYIQLNSRKYLHARLGEAIQLYHLRLFYALSDISIDRKTLRNARRREARSRLLNLVREQRLPLGFFNNCQASTGHGDHLKNHSFPSTHSQLGLGPNPSIKVPNSVAIARPNSNSKNSRNHKPAQGARTPHLQ